MRRGFLGLLLAGVLASTPAWSQSAPGGPALVPPRGVVIYVHADLKADAFVDPLVCELRRVLAVPVWAQPLELPIGPDVMASASQLDVSKLATRLTEATRGDGGPETFKFLLTSHDLTGGKYRYVFGASMGNPYNSGVVSTARLAPSAGSPQLTMQRTYKIILRYIAQLAGYRTAEGCVLAFPRGLGELDAKPSEFCAADRAVLVEAGLLKARPGGGCTPIAQLDRKIL